jgi:HK97 family phage major capsid protein
LNGVITDLKSATAKLEVGEVADGETVEGLERNVSDLTARAEQIKAEIKKTETVEKAKSLTRSNEFWSGNKAPMVKVVNAPTYKDKNNAFKAWLMSGTGASISDNFKRSADVVDCNFQADEFICRAQSTTTTEGGFGINGTNVGPYEKALKQYGGLLELCDVKVTETGATYNWPSFNDTANLAAYVAENSAVSNTSVTMANKAYGAYNVKTAIFEISQEIVEDSAEDILALAEAAVYERIARQFAAIIATGAGSGSNQGRGVTLDSVEGSTYTTDTTPYLTKSAIDTLLYSIDPEYVNDPSFAFACHNSVKGYIAAMEDTTGQPLWGAGLNGMASNTLSGHRLVVSNNLPVLPAEDASAKVLVAGAWNRMKVRLVGAAPRIFREPHLYQNKFAYGVFGMHRMDCGILAPTHGALKHLTLTLNAA